MDGKKHYIRHLKTPDRSIKNDCLIRALCGVTGKSYYLICKKLHIPYVVKGYQHSIPDYVDGVSLYQYENAFGYLIQEQHSFTKDRFSWWTIKQEAESGKLPTLERFTKTISRRKLYHDKKLIVHCYSLKYHAAHSVYVKNGYYYDSNNHDDWLVVCFDVFA